MSIQINNIDVSDEKPKIIEYMSRNFICYETTPPITTIRDTAIDLTFTNIQRCTTNSIYTPWSDHYLQYTHVPIIYDTNN